MMNRYSRWPLIDLQVPSLGLKTDWKKLLSKSAFSLLFVTKRGPSLKKLGDRFCFVIDLTKDQKHLVLVRSESFSLAAYCFFFILIIASTSRLACLTRSWSRVLSRLIATFLNLFFTLIRFRSSWSIHGCSFTFRGLLVLFYFIEFIFTKRGKAARILEKKQNKKTKTKKTSLDAK